MPSIVSTVYKALHTNVYLLQSKWQKWETTFNIQIWPNEFLRLFNYVWLVTKNSKLRSFQYKLLNHAVVTNIKLKLWNIVESDCCTLCNRDLETVTHLLVHCSKIQALWETIKNWCIQIEPEVDFSEKNIVFGTVSKNPKSTVNVIVLITKYYIYKSRCLNTKPQAIELKEYILWHHKMELLGAKVKGTFQKCESKWLPIITVIKY